MLGRTAVKMALEGHSGEMVTLNRKSDFPYETEITGIALEQVAGKDRVLDLRYVTPEQNYIYREYLNYILPLIGELPKYADLKMVKAVPEE